MHFCSDLCFQNLWFQNIGYTVLLNVYVGGCWAFVSNRTLSLGALKTESQGWKPYRLNYIDQQYSGVILHMLCNPLPVLWQMEICSSGKVNVQGQTVCAIGHSLPISQSEDPGSAQVQSLLDPWWQRCTSKY